MCLKASELNSDKAELIPSERQGIIVFIAKELTSITYMKC